MDHTNLTRRLRAMKCIVQGCPGEMEQRRIVHTFVRDGNPIVVEDLPALVCPVCGYTVLDLRVLDTLFALDPETETPVGQAPVFRLPLSLTA
ncbi:MAG: YgiT-type zinc finger protein [Anaerolineales bacterium]|nr:MAG: YgiT-type zinc finger protein [Anaerolineales bacterium]